MRWAHSVLWGLLCAPGAGVLAVEGGPAAAQDRQAKEELTRKLWPAERIEAALKALDKQKAQGLLSEASYRKRKDMLEARRDGKYVSQSLSVTDPPLNFIQNGGFEKINRNSARNRSRWLWWGGWDGIDHHNQGRRLLNKAFLLELQEKTGAIPWFVNAGTGRLPFGFFFWKMARYGARGKVEWYYNLRNERGSVVRTEGATVWPTLDYERSREGIDDLKYLCKLEALIAEAGKTGKAAEQARAAGELLARIADSIQDDWSAYQSGGAQFPADGFAVMAPEKAAAIGEFNAIRRAVADRIVALQDAMK